MNRVVIHVCVKKGFEYGLIVMDMEAALCSLILYWFSWYEGILSCVCIVLLETKNRRAAFQNTVTF